MAIGREQQIEILRGMAAGRGLDGVFVAMTVTAIGCAGLAWWTREIGFLLAAIFAAVVALSGRQTAPHVRRAALALDAGERSPGNLTIEVSRWSDSDTWRATVAGRDGRHWRFEFIPQGWTPVAGATDAQLCFADDTHWPALAIVADGILYPRSTPRPVPDRHGA